MKDSVTGGTGGGGIGVKASLERGSKPFTGVPENKEGSNLNFPAFDGPLARLGSEWASGPRRASGQQAQSGQALQRATGAQIHLQGY